MIVHYPLSSVHSLASEIPLTIKPLNNQWVGWLRSIVKQVFPFSAAMVTRSCADSVLYRFAVKISSPALQVCISPALVATAQHCHKFWTPSCAHPWRTIYERMHDQENFKRGIPLSLIGVVFGLQHINGIIHDFEQVFDGAGWSQSNIES